MQLYPYLGVQLAADVYGSTLRVRDRRRLVPSETSIRFSCTFGADVGSPMAELCQPGSQSNGGSELSHRRDARGFRMANRAEVPLSMAQPSAKREPSHRRSDMTGPIEDPVSRARQLESIVDELDESVADEREADGVPGKPSDRANAVTRGTEDEPPD